MKFCSEHGRALPWLWQGGCSRGFEILSALKPGRGKGLELSWRLHQASRHSRTGDGGKELLCQAQGRPGKAQRGLVEMDLHSIKPQAFMQVSCVQENLISPAPCISLDL